MHATQMDKEQILGTLREHAQELREAGLVHLHLFGSVARGQANARSDIDLMADFDPSKRITLVTLGRLENHLTSLLGTKVDLSSSNWMREPVRGEALREAVLAF